MRHDIFSLGVLKVLGALEGKTAEEMAQSLLEQECKDGVDDALDMADNATQNNANVKGK